jgi:hypothetical protein
VGAAQVLFIVGASLLIVAGAGHALLALRDDWRPRFFTPIDDRVRPNTDRTGIRFRALFPGGSQDRPSMWRAWLGFNISHGLGAAAFGLIVLLLAASDFDRVTETEALMPVTVAVSSLYLATSLRFWFYGPTILVSTTTACFAVAYGLALGG